MPTCIIRDPGIGYWTTEADYDRRYEAHLKMSYWWHKTITLWGIANGLIKCYTQKEKPIQ